MIRRLVASQFHSILKGRTRPLLCGCSDDSDRYAGDYVTKLRGSVERGEDGIVCELLASQLAAHFAILVPEPSVVEITQQFAELVAACRPEIAGKVRQSVGLNFGSKLMTDAVPWPVDRSIPDIMRQPALHTFAFDALIQNPDRGFDNPNLFTHGDDLYLYDHELGFSFLLDIVPSTKPWTLDGEAYLDKHVFFTRLKSKPADISGFIDSLKKLTDGVIERMCADMPVSAPGLTKIQKHLSEMRKHADDFGEAVLRRLA